MARRATLGLLLWLPLAGRAATADVPAEAPVPLAAGATVSRVLQAGESHRYRFELREGEFVQAAVEQKGVDVTLTVTGPDGAALLEAADSPTTENGPEPLAFVAKAGGPHLLTITTGPAPPTAGSTYEIRVDAIRAPAALDLERVRAAAMTAESVRLFQGGEEHAARTLALMVEARAAWRTVGEPRMEMWLENALGFFENDYFDRYAEGTRHYQAAVALAGRLGDEAARAHILVALGQSYRQAGQLDAARQTLEEALALHRTAGRRPREAWVLTLLGVISDLSGDAQGALDQLAEAERVYAAAGDRRNAAVVQTKIGATYLRLGEYEQAIAQFRSALPAFEARERRFAAQTLGQIGVAQARLGRRAEARASYGEALRAYAGLGNRAFEAYTSLDLAALEREEGRASRALEIVTQALAAFRASGDQAGEAAAQCELGETQRLLGDAAAARAGFRAASELTSPARNLPVLLCVEQGLARLLRDAGELDAARSHAEAAVDAVESRRATVLSPQTRASALASSQQLYELLIDLHMRQHQAQPAAGHQAAAFEAAERARARSLFELLAAGRLDIREGADPALLADERALRQRLNAQAEALELAQGSGRGQRAAVLEREVGELTGRLAEAETRLRRSSPRYAALTRPQPLRLDQVREQALDAETVLLEYAFGEESGYLFVVSKQGLTAQRLAPRAEIEGAARRVHDLLAAAPRRSRAAVPAAVRALSALVLPPQLERELERLAARRLLVVAPGALQYVPFGVLTLPGRDAVRLMARFELVSAPSASVAATLRAESRPKDAPTRSVAVFADAVFEATDPRVPAPAPGNRTGIAQGRRAGGALSRLPFSRQEAAAILAAAPAGTAFSALGFDASRAAATGASLSGYRIIHFATHAVLNTRRPELSGIVLSLVDSTGRPQDGFLRLHDIYNLRLDAELVVLSGCQTGLGQDLEGEGLVGLTRGFMYAGAPRVVASLWQVDDLATAELMKRFYRAMFARKLGPAAALRAAQLELAATRAWSDPYYWAPFVLHGDWR